MTSQIDVKMVMDLMGPLTVERPTGPKRLVRLLPGAAPKAPAAEGKAATEGKAGERLRFTTSTPMELNADFQSQMKRIVYDPVQLEATVRTEQISQDRVHQIEAATVRVMKARKRMQHEVS